MSAAQPSEPRVFSRSAFLPRQWDSSQYVYFIRINGDGPIKIGRSDAPNDRLVSLLTGSPYPLEIVGVINTHKNREEFFETELHKRFDHHRIRGEWFEPAPEVLDFVATYADEWPWEQEPFVDKRGKRCLRFVTKGIILDKRGDYRYVYNPYSKAMTVRRIKKDEAVA